MDMDDTRRWVSVEVPSGRCFILAMMGHVIRRPPFPTPLPLRLSTSSPAGATITMADHLGRHSGSTGPESQGRKSSAAQ